MINTLTEFLEDEDALEMFITGQAGTGKTTGLAKLVQYCIEHDIDHTVCAYTHKACGILRSKLPDGANVQTLHKYLKKRPTINTEAKNHKHIEKSMKHGISARTSVLFIDEYSMVGEADLMDIREEDTKVVWLGDPNQLPPVGDVQSVVPYGKYAKTLTKVYRQAADNPLMATLGQLVSFIEGKPSEPLHESDKFIRNQDIAEWYDNDRMSDSFDGVMLAFTNKQVQHLNAQAQGRDMPEKGDRLFSPTTKHHYTFVEWLDTTYQIDLPFGDPLPLGSKYRTLEHLLTQDYKLASVVDDDGDELIFMCEFGHYAYKTTAEGLKKAAAASNSDIGDKAAQWARQHPNDAKSKTRAKAWRNFLSFNEAVICLDFAHAMTVHKSQGSTYKSVYLDTDDLGIMADINYTTYLKLMYVAVSRASDYVVTS